MKKNVLFMVAALLLCGAVSAQNWGTTDAHAKSSNTPIVAKVTVDGAAVTPTADYKLGAFVGEELRGLAAPHSDNNFWIQVFYNQGTSEDISFKLYDGTNEYTTCSVTKTTQEEGWGTPSEPVALDFVSTQIMTQTTALAAGWNWWSSYIELNDDALTTLENGMGNNGEQILSGSGNYVRRNVYNGFVYWSGNLPSINNEEMYAIQTNAACNVNISGQRASVTSHPITINHGWNWIGFPSSQSISVSEALQGFTPESGDQIKGRSGYANYTYNESYGFGWWSGTLNSFEPGQGYKYKSNSDITKTLIYHTASKAESPTATITNSTFQPQQENYANNMTVTAIVKLDGEELRSEDYEIAAYVGDQCRGSVKLMYVEPLGRYEAFLLVFGEAEEPIHFALTDGNQISWSDDYVLFGIDNTVGSTTEPVILHFGPLSVEDNSKALVNVYPNPSKNVFNIEGKDIQKIEVIDNHGQIILSKELRNDFIQIDLSDKTVGAYLLRVYTSNEVYTNKLIKNN